MGTTLGISNEDQRLNKALAMGAFKKIYQKNRNEKKPGKLMFDELGFYHQFFEEEMTVKKFSELQKKKKSNEK